MCLQTSGRLEGELFYERLWGGEEGFRQKLRFQFESPNKHRCTKRESMMLQELAEEHLYKLQRPSMEDSVCNNALEPLLQK